MPHTLQFLTDPGELGDLLNTDTPTSDDETVNALHEACIALAFIALRQQKQIDKLKAELDEREARAISKAEGRRYE